MGASLASLQVCSAKEERQRCRCKSAPVAETLPHSFHPPGSDGGDQCLAYALRDARETEHPPHLNHSHQTNHGALECPACHGLFRGFFHNDDRFKSHIANRALKGQESTEEETFCAEQSPISHAEKDVARQLPQEDAKAMNHDPSTGEDEENEAQFCFTRSTSPPWAPHGSLMSRLSNLSMRGSADVFKGDSALSVTHGEYADTLWERHVLDKNYNFFAHKRKRRFATDGGLTDMGTLLTDLMYFKAAWKVLLCIANMSMIMVIDIEAITEHWMMMSSDKFLVSKWVAKGLFIPKEQTLDIIVPVLELFSLVFLLTRLIISALIAGLCLHRKDRLRWTFTAHICWDQVNLLWTFNAVRLLWFIAPDVIFLDMTIIVTHAWQRLGASKGKVWRKRSVICRTICDMFRFLCLRMTAFIIGFDALLVKMRLAYRLTNKPEMDMYCLFWGAAFTAHILFVINLKLFATKRLFLFIFGHEDGTLDVDDYAQVEVWQAFMAKSIYEHYGFLRGTVIMLGFDDYDLQRLVLHDEEVPGDCSRTTSSKTTTGSKAAS